MHLHLGVLPGEPLLVVADVVHREADEVGEVVVRHRVRAARLAGQNDAVGRDQRFAGDAGVRIGAEEGIQDRIAQTIGDLVRMPLRYRFGGEQKLAFVAH